MKVIRLFLLILMTIALFSSCKKEAGPQGPEGQQGPTEPGGIGNTDSRLYTKWQVVSGYSETKYIIIKSDNSFYQLDSAAYGFKSLYSATALITGSQIYGWDLCNYTINNDTLKLTNIDRTVILIKNVNAPDETAWVTPVTAIDSINVPFTVNDGREDIGFDGTNILWTGNYDSDTVYKINPSTHSIAGYIPLTTTYSYGSINYAASNIWLSNYNTIDKINPANGAIISSSPGLAQYINSLALVGNTMWYSSGGDIYTWDVISNNITHQLQLYAYGMEYVNGYLYVNNGNFIHKCQLSPFLAIKTYQIKSSYYEASYYGLTFDGTKFWIVMSAHSNNYTLIRLSI
jgi:hypothetical protein